MNQTFASHTAHADRSTEARIERLEGEAGLFDREPPASPLHISFLVALVVAVLGGATALMDDGATIGIAKASAPARP